MTIDQLADYYGVPRAELATANAMMLDALRYAVQQGIKIRRVHKCWEIRDPINPGNVVKIADCWLTKGEITRLKRQ